MAARTYKPIGDPPLLDRCRERVKDELRDWSFQEGEIEVSGGGVKGSVGVAKDKGPSVGLSLDVGPASGGVKLDKISTSVTGGLNFDAVLLRVTAEETRIFSFNKEKGEVVQTCVDDDAIDTISRRGINFIILSADSWQFKVKGKVVKAESSRKMGPLKFLKTEELIGNQWERTMRQVYFSPKLKFTVGVVDFEMKGEIDISSSFGLAGSYRMDGDKKGSSVAGKGAEGQFTRLDSGQAHFNYTTDEVTHL